MECSLEENIKVDWEVFIYFLDNFVLNIWIIRKVSYFVGILCGVWDIFLPDCSQVLSLLNVGPRGISEPHKSLVQRGESSYR